MTGTAYRTAITPRAQWGPFITDAAVYAVYPGVPFEEVTPDGCGGVTNFVIVSAVERSYDAQVFACSQDGELLSWMPIAWSLGTAHAPCLLSAGFVLEMAGESR